MRILHVFRSPVGGLFRHVCDLARGQHAQGHEVGIVSDSGDGDGLAQQKFAAIAPYCLLGIHRAPIARNPGLGDLRGTRFVISTARQTRPDVIHCHGAKGGLFGRLAASLLGIPSTYTPHNGTLAYEWNSALGVTYLTAEKILRSLGAGLTFVCNFEQAEFDRKIGISGKPFLTTHNGIWPEEFRDAGLRKDATDFMAMCEIRKFKGIDVLIRALARFPAATLTVVGEGPERAACEELVRQLDLSDRVHFSGAKSLAEGLTYGRIMVLSSHLESFPYVVIEAGAVRKPLVATAVGGVPEVVPKTLLCPPGDVDGLYHRMKEAVEQQPANVAAQEEFFQMVRTKCSADSMCRSITAFYEQLRPSQGTLTPR